MHSLKLLLVVLCVFALPVHAQSGMTLEQIATLRMVTQAKVSPDGRQLAYALSVPRALGSDDDGPAWTELHVADVNGASRGFVTGKVNVAGLNKTGVRVDFFKDQRS